MKKIDSFIIEAQMIKEIYDDLLSLQAKVKTGKISEDKAEGLLASIRNCSAMKSVPKNIEELLNTDLANRRGLKLSALSIAQADAKEKRNDCSDKTLNDKIF